MNSASETDRDEDDDGGFGDGDDHSRRSPPRGAEDTHSPVRQHHDVPVNPVGNAATPPRPRCCCCRYGVEDEETCLGCGHSVHLACMSQDPQHPKSCKSCAWTQRSFFNNGMLNMKFCSGHRCNNDADRVPDIVSGSCIGCGGNMHRACSTPIGDGRYCSHCHSPVDCIISPNLIAHAP